MGVKRLTSWTVLCDGCGADLMNEVLGEVDEAWFVVPEEAECEALDFGWIRGGDAWLCGRCEPSREIAGVAPLPAGGR